MKLNAEELLNDRTLVTPASVAKTCQVARSTIYDAIKADKIDWCEIDGVKFVIVNERTINYIGGKSDKH